MQRLLMSLAVCLFPMLLSAAEPAGAKIVEVRKIWDKTPHSAFTDLIRLNDRWYCSFRVGQGHVSKDGSLQVITSSDGQTWESAALLSDTMDLRDPKLSITPQGELMMVGAKAYHKPGDPFVRQSIVSFSKDGREWSKPLDVADRDYWLWRVTWHKGTAYGTAYRSFGVGAQTTQLAGTQREARLYKSTDGRKFETLVASAYTEGFPNEGTVLFMPDDTCYWLLRRDDKAKTSVLGTSHPPYTDWSWKETGTKIGGPNFIRLPDGRLVAVVRLYDKKVRTALCWLDPEQAKLTEFLTLPSGGDTSYTGLVWHEGLLWISYYSSHEGKTSIYLAKVAFDK